MSTTARLRFEWLPRGVSVGLRVAAMGSRFVLLLVLAKLLSPAQVGLFGLLLATISFSVLVIGGDFYTYSQRELMRKPRHRWSFVLQHQILAIGLLYLLLLPLQLLIFWFDLLPVHLMVWFFGLLVLEHVAQEVNRLLVAMHRPLVASWVLFVRMGAWVWVVLPFLWFAPEPSLEMVLLAWLVGSGFAALMGVIVVHREARPWHKWSWESGWLKQGFKVGLLFLVATMCVKALLTVDRYIVEALNGADFLGVYVVYASMAMAVMSFLDAAVFSFMYPRLVGAFRQANRRAYLKYRRELAVSTVAISAALALLIALVSPLVLEWTGRAIYLEHLDVLWLLLGTSVVYSIGMVPHYGLYARGADWNILFAHVSSLVVFSFMTAAFAGDFPIQAVGFGLLSAFVWMGLVKQFQYVRHVRMFGFADSARIVTEGVD